MRQLFLNKTLLLTCIAQLSSTARGISFVSHGQFFMSTSRRMAVKCAV